MRRKFQEGGLATAQQLQDPNQTVLGIFQSMNMTTPEAQRWAREYLEGFQEYDYAAEEEILQRQRDLAEESRQALIAAREAVLGEQYDDRTMWLDFAAAMGAPTKSGHFGEALGRGLGAIAEGRRSEREFLRQQREEALGFSEQLRDIDQGTLEMEMALQQLRRGQELGLAKSAATILGRRTPPRPPSVTQLPGIKSLDQRMAGEYTTWIAGGQADIQQQQVALVDVLRTLEESDTISGPWVGIIPRSLRDLVLPEASNVQDVVEGVTQRSLKAILGGQFGEREGMLLLARAYNPRLEEEVNRPRVFRLLQTIATAAQEKERAFQWFEDYGTMAGYDGKTEWSLADFIPPPIMQRVRMVPGDDSTIISVPDHWTREEVQHFYETGEEPFDPLMEWIEQNEAGRQEFKKGGKVRRRRRRKYQTGGKVRGYRKKPAKPKHLKMQRYQQGGPVEEDDEVLDVDQLESGEDQVVDIGERGRDGIGPGDVISTVGGAAVGAGVGLAAESAGTAVYERATGFQRPTWAEQRVGEAMERSGVTPMEARAGVRRAQRQGTPSMLIDEAGRVAQGLGEVAAMRATEPGDIFLQQLEERFAGSRDRVGRVVERGLRSPEFFAQEQLLTDRLYERARPLYQQAYAEAEPIAFPEGFDEWLQRPSAQRAYDIAVQFMQDKGRPLGPADATGMSTRFSLEFWDEMKRAFDQMIRTEEAMGPTPQGRNLRRLRGDLLTYLNANAPQAWLDARAQYAGDLEVLEALDIGRREFHRLAPQEVAQMYNDMGWAERNALRTGVAQHIYDVIYNPSTNIDAARRLIGSTANRDRLRVLFDKPAEWRIFEAALEREMDIFQRDRRSTGRIERGRTAQQVDQVTRMGDPITPVTDAISRSPLAWVVRTLGAVGRRRAIISEQQADEIVEILRTGRLDELDAITPRLEAGRQYSAMRRGRRGKAALVGAAIGTGVAAFAEDTEAQEELDELDLQTIREALRIETEQ